MILLVTAFGLAVVTSALCIIGVLMRWMVSSTPAQTCAMLLIPVAIAGLPLLFSRGGKAMIATAYAAALLLFIWVGVTGFSVGMFYLPATVVMGVAAVRMAMKTPVAKPNKVDQPS
ncbi:MAG TPA: hypothetical protein VJN43_22065 [Bryobacteraceae bacterium]|nr:hypothetical protein [Bryobacteraceae bacterium]